MALEGMQNRKDMSPVNSFAKAMFIPVGKGIVNTYVGGNLPGGRMGKGVLGISAVEEIVQGSGEGEEQTRNRLFHTGGVRVGHGVQFGRCTRRAVAAVAGAALTSKLDAVLPV
jgi:hypothetical protein